MSRTSRALVAISSALLASLGVAAAVVAGIAVVVPRAGVPASEASRVFGLTLTEAGNALAFLPVFTGALALLLAWKVTDRKTRVRTALAALVALLVTFLLPLAWVWIDPPAASDASEGDRADLIAGTIGDQLFNAWLLALVTVPLAGFLAWRSTRRRRS
jgi:hypothetical protein